MDELFRIIGQITYSFTRIEFLLSNIATDLNIVPTTTKFFAEAADQKIQKIMAKAITIKNEEIRNELVDCLNRIDKLRINRNDIIHSLIMKNVGNGDEYNLFNYNRKGDRKIKKYTTLDFKKVNDEFVQIHNQCWECWIKITKEVKPLQA
jgi:hypothetical protein